MKVGIPKLWLFATASLICASAALLWWTYFIYPESTALEGTTFNKMDNGLWLRYKWYAGDPEYWSKLGDLIDRLKTNHIRYAYFHVHSLKEDGTLWMRKEQTATELVMRIHDKIPYMNVLAWISLGKAYPAHGTDLSKASVRQAAVKEAIWLTETCGFDGIQYDYEPCPDGDQGFLLLLEETKKILATNKKLSVATPMIQSAGIPSTWYSWSPAYFSEVAKRSDQVAMMCYDMANVLPWLYVDSVKRQTEILPTTLKNTKCSAILGLPAYTKNFFHDHCETVRLGLKGIRAARPQDTSKISGVALFADYTATDKDWEDYRRWWLLGSTAVVRVPRTASSTDSRGCSRRISATTPAPTVSSAQPSRPRCDAPELRRH